MIIAGNKRQASRQHLPINVTQAASCKHVHLRAGVLLLLLPPGCGQAKGRRHRKPAAAPQRPEGASDPMLRHMALVSRHGLNAWSMLQFMWRQVS